MLVSRKLLHRTQNQLQIILGLIEMGQTARAVATIRELGMSLSAHVETPEQEQARAEREDHCHDCG